MKGIVPLGLRPSADAPVNVPIAVGLEKLPAASDNSAVKMLPRLNVPVVVKSTFPVAEVLHVKAKGEVATAVVVMVLVERQKF